MLRRTFNSFLVLLPLVSLKKKKMVKVIEVTTDNQFVTFRENGTNNTITKELSWWGHNPKALIKTGVKIYPTHHWYVFRKSNLSERLVFVGNNTTLLVDPSTMLVEEKWYEAE